jgi:hypothetical protein
LSTGKIGVKRSVDDNGYLVPKINTRASWDVMVFVVSSFSFIDKKQDLWIGPQDWTIIIVRSELIHIEQNFVKF